jgi:SNF2 family DNA or RNA helicase
LISLKAGGTGLNLTGADTVIHYDPWWNPAAQAQATDRAHRIGQTKPVFVHNLIVSGSVEERMLQLQQHKQQLASGLLSDAGVSAPQWSEQQVDQLFAPLQRG